LEQKHSGSTRSMRGSKKRVLGDAKVDRVTTYGIAQGKLE
jgi:hypothetical protein